MSDPRPNASWRAAIVFGSNVIHASWLTLLFCQRADAIEETWVPMSGTDAVTCPECQSRLANWLLLKEDQA